MDFLQSNKALINTHMGTVVLGGRQIKSSRVEANVAAFVGWKINSEAGPSPINVYLDETGSFAASHAGYVRLVPSQKLEKDWWKSYYFSPDGSSNIGRLLSPGIVRVDENNHFVVMFINFGPNVHFRRKAKVGTLHEVEIDRSQGSVNSVQGIDSDTQPADEAKSFDINDPARVAKIRQLLEAQDMSLSPAQKREVIDRLMKFVDVWALEEDPLNLSSKFEHKIRIIPHAPIYNKPYPIPHAYTDAVRKQVRDMEAAGIIEPSRSPYNSPIVVVRQKDQLRVCNDYRAINK